MPRGKPHPPEVRAAVLADLLAGNSVRYAARKHHISTHTISEWRDEAGIRPQVDPMQMESFGELIAAYLRKSLRALAAQADQFADPEWIKAQTAGDLAELHGGLLDRTVQILAALERANTPDPGLLAAPAPDAAAR